MNSRLIKTMAGGCAVAALAFPAGALARGGGGGGGGADVPAPVTGPACATVEAMNSGVLDQPASHKPITIDLKLTNCSTTRTTTVSTTLVGTASTVRSLDPFVVDTCATAPYGAQQLTLKPRESRTIEAAAQIPFCGKSLWGVNGYDVTYDVTASDAADGTVLGSTTSVVQHRGGV